jgi:hypothetical protein
MSDYVIPNPKIYWSTVCEDIPTSLVNTYTKSEPDEQLCSLLYMVRLYVQKTDSYVYKVGWTEDFYKRLATLNSTFDSCGRIIPVLLARCGSQKKERMIHAAFKHISTPIKIRFTLHKETYAVSPENYDEIKKVFMQYLVKKCKSLSGDADKRQKCSGNELCKKCKRIFWESESYCIDEKLPYFELYQNSYLRQDNSEEAFWASHLFV